MAQLAFSGCSNPVDWRADKLAALVTVFEDAGHRVDLRMVDRFAGHELRAGGRVWRIEPRARAELVNELFADDAVDAIFDITGGDLSNEVLGRLDWELISAHPKPFAGYSDLSTIVNAIPAMTGHQATLWNPWTALERGPHDIDRIIAGKPIVPHVFGERELPPLPIVGGNLRCFSKLGGTPYWSRPEKPYLALLESMRMDLEAVASYTEYLKQIGLFTGAAGVILGQLTDIDRTGERASALDLVREITGLEVWEAPQIGHSYDAAPVTIG
ncbi:LD-carboxypeptidase [Trueperella pyogenes]|uniref:LD-carboxypeptidase n=1 Tax=Trueperella pyogenes TaxID=1661 RepID=A0ABV3NDG4_9ACTO|nr:LD-carboxypeptidase [Trueperella pyogenes]MCI7690173.1 LD-carboxypeptidase [Trueperella pyogenes]UVJ53063.1 LD-carboxypeptidase [Trueperella pyogenes]